MPLRSSPVWGDPVIGPMHASGQGRFPWLCRTQLRHLSRGLPLLGGLMLASGSLPLRAQPQISASPYAEQPALPQASEIRPGDWSHTALRDLFQEGNCQANPLQSLLEAGVPLNRDEAASLLRTCLDAPMAISAELRQRLQQEFAQELLRSDAPLDDLEARTDRLAASRFSTLTTLRGDARWWLGAANFSGNQINRGANTYDGLPLRNAFVFNYDVRLAFNTSFHGDDLLHIRLRSGNGGRSPFRDSIAPTLRMNSLWIGCPDEGPCRSNWLLVDKIFYQFSSGPHLRITFGGRVNQRDMVAIWPALFDDNENLLTLFGKAGAPGAYSNVKGAGAGIHWIQRNPPRGGAGWIASAVTVLGEPQSGDAGEGGLFNGASEAASTLQLGYQGSNWTVAAAYTYAQAGARDRASMTPLALETWPQPGAGLGGHVNAFALSGFWQPSVSGWLPGVTLGWGYNGNVFSGSGKDGLQAPQLAESQSWMLALNWFDVVLQGSELGFAIGSPVSISRYRNPFGQEGAADQTMQMELWYRMLVSDRLTITPGVFWLPRPRGQLTTAGSRWNDSPLPLGQDSTFSAFGAVVKLRFRF